jgi:hypothetical protein
MAARERLVPVSVHAVSYLLSNRGLRWLLLAAACLSAIGLFLLATATENTELFARGYDTLVVLNMVMVGLLMLIVAWQLWQLRRNLKRGVFGSKLAARLVLLFALVAVLPGALVYAVSVQFLGRSIESWFDVRVDRALEGGLALGRNALDYLSRETTNKATQIASQVGDAAGQYPIVLSRASEQAGVSEVALFNATGAVLAVAGAAGGPVSPEPPPPQALRSARLQMPYAAVEALPTGGFRLRVVVPVNSADRNDPLKVLQLIEPVPRSLAQEIDKAEAGLPRLPGDLVLAHGAQAPLRADADAHAPAGAHLGARPRGRAVRALRRAARPARRGHARGRAGRLLAPPAGDLARRARRAHRVVQHDDRPARRRACAQRGIAPRDRDDARVPREHPRQPVGRRARVRRPAAPAHREPERERDPAAAARRPVGRRASRVGRRLPALAPFAELVAEGFRNARDGQWQREAPFGVASLSRTLLMRGSTLPGAPHGYVVVFDDVSELMQAQRDAAWAEVARRLAHEIKNPLTPIQLSAERLAVKLEGRSRAPTWRRSSAARRRSSTRSPR